MLRLRQILQMLCNGIPQMEITYILQRTTFPQQAYGKCSGSLALARKYGKSRLEHACMILKEETLVIL